MKRLVFIALLGATVAGARTLAAQAAPPAGTAIDFSGIIFGSFNVRTDSAARATLGGKAPNQFSLDRAYLNFRMPAGDNGAIRITTDVFQNTSSATNGYYQGWMVRIKYAWLQYTGWRGGLGTGSSLMGRVGLINNSVIDYEEQFWPRPLGSVGLERHGFFSSADGGVAGILTLGNKMGEVYGLIANGPGYTSFDRDRFKDLSLRVALTPFANRTSANAFVKSFAIAPWVYFGNTGSAFAAGGAGQVGPGDNGAVTDGLTRDRYGVFTGIKDRRLTAGLQFAKRKDQSETGANTTVSPRVATDSSGELISGFLVARPMEWLDAARRSPFGIVARYDRFTPNTSPTSANYAGTTPSYAFTVLGLQYDLTQRVVLTLDWQATTPTSFPAATGTNVRPAPKQSTVFLHWQASF